MKRSWTALAVILFALGVLAGCNDYNNSVQYDTGATLLSISPSGMPAGTPTTGTLVNCPNTPAGQSNPCFTLFVQASVVNGFNSNSVVQWNGQKLPLCATTVTGGCTTFIDSADLTAQIPYSFVAKPGSAFVNTFQPQSGTGLNGLSNSLTFIIYGAPNPVPTLTSVTPASAAYCDPKTKCADVPITLAGNNFLPTSQNGGSSVTFTGLATYNTETAVAVTSISSTQLKATIPGSYLCATDGAKINVINPPSAICIVNCPNLGGGDTNNPPSGQPVTTQTFTISNSSSINSCPPQPPPPTSLVARVTFAISRDGRYVAYPSTQNGISQILLRDTCLGAAKDCAASTRTVSVGADGTAGNSDSHNPAMTLDGRYVAFSSLATNLVENAPSGRQVYLHDTCIGASGSCKPSTQLVSTDGQGKLSGAEAVLPSIGASGRYVAFLSVSRSQALTPANTVHAAAAATGNSSLRQLFVRDTCTGAMNCTPKTTGVVLQPTLAEETPAISQDGRYVVYVSTQNGISQILLRDTCLGVSRECTPSTRTISAVADRTSGNGDSHNAVMTPDGRYVAFSSAATNLVENAAIGRQIYLRDTCIGVAGACKPSTVLASIDEEGKLGGTEAILPSLSTSGRFVAFLAVAPSSVAGAVPNSGLRQVFVRDTCLGVASCTPKTARISLQPGDATVDFARPAGPALAGLGQHIALADGKHSTVFTPTVAIDDSVFLAIPNEIK
ncbi:MAG: hypothetical protein WBL63_24490 [Candidatus Acidiferrum sp.]